VRHEIVPVAATVDKEEGFLAPFFTPKSRYRRCERMQGWGEIRII
jgi:hypothetical protein